MQNVTGTLHGARPMSRALTMIALLALPLALFGCPRDSASGKPDARAGRDSAVRDGSAAVDTATADTGGASDASVHADGAKADAAGDGPVESFDAAPPTFNCKMFASDPGWTVASGFRAVTVADSASGLSEPVAAVFAGGDFNYLLYVVNQRSRAVMTIDVNTGEAGEFVPATAWTGTPVLTGLVWDQQAAFDGNLYVADQGGNGDADSRVFRVTPTGQVSLFVSGPGPGLDDIYGIAFAPAGTAYSQGLYLTGDTDGANDDWGVFGADAQGTVFSQIPGGEGIAFDTTGRYGGGLFVASALGGGYSGDGTITPVQTNGKAGTPLASGLGGIHAIVFSNGGAFGKAMYAASWSTGKLVRIDPDGTVSTLASGLTLTNYNANALAVSPDGNTMLVADRLANRVVCIEPVSANHGG